MNFNETLNNKSFEEFRKELLHPKKPVNVLVTNSYGINDAYRWAKKNGLLNHFNISRQQFNGIITRINAFLSDRLSLGDEVTLPKGMGKLMILKKRKSAKFKNGKLIANYPINWAKTHRLWYSDPEAFKQRIVVRDQKPYTYRLFYDNTRARVKNINLYSFKVNRFLHIKTKKNFEQGITLDVREYDYGLY